MKVLLSFFLLLQTAVYIMPVKELVNGYLVSCAAEFNDECFKGSKKEKADRAILLLYSIEKKNFTIYSSPLLYNIDNSQLPGQVEKPPPDVT